MATGTRIACNLTDPRLQDNLASGGDRCAALGGADRNFGNPSPGLTIIDPAILEGWGVRESDWQFGVSAQQEVLPRVSIEVGYNRRWFQNFLVTDNQLVGPADYDPWTLTTPLHPDLPGGGGYRRIQHHAGGVRRAPRASRRSRPTSARRGPDAGTGSMSRRTRGCAAG
jgi:hypothetical protein